MILTLQYEHEQKLGITEYLITEHKSVVMQVQLIKGSLHLMCLFFMQLCFGLEQRVFCYVVSHGSQRYVFV